MDDRHPRRVDSVSSPLDVVLARQGHRPPKSDLLLRAEPLRLANTQRATVADLKAHVAQVTSEDDAWQQALDLSRLAQRKFDASGKAIWGFALVTVFGVSCVVTAVALTR